MLKSVNTPMQETNNAACLVMIMMNFSRCEKKVLPGVTKLMINEQDITVRTCKKVEYITSKLYENK